MNDIDKYREFLRENSRYVDNIRSTDKWDLRFLEMAELVSTWSKDPSTKCGAVLVRPDKTVASIGYNGFPRAMDDDEKIYLDRDEKLRRVIHAELNALFNSRDHDHNRYTMYTHPGMSCDRCAVHLIQNGITTVVSSVGNFFREEYHHHSLGYFREAGVSCICIDEDVNLVYYL